MAYTPPPHTAKQIVNAFGVETEYAESPRIAPTFSFGTGCAITHHSKNNPENQQPIAKETNSDELPITLTKEHYGSGNFNLCYGKPLQFIGSGVYNRQIGGGGANYNHVVNFLSKTINSFTIDIARRHTIPFVTEITGAYMKNLNIRGAIGEVVKCRFDYTAHDVDDGSTVPIVTETTYPEVLMAKSPITVPTVAHEEGEAIGYITNIDFTIIRKLDETRDIATAAQYLQTEPALLKYPVEGNLTIKLFDTEFWNHFQAETIEIADIANINRFNVVFTKSATDKIIFSFGDLYIPEDEIPSPMDGILTETFNFTAHKQKTMISSTADGNTANEVVDSAVTFPAGIEGAFVHNTDDNTWGVVLERVTDHRLYMSADVCPDGNEAYDIFRPAISIMSVDQEETH